MSALVSPPQIPSVALPKEPHVAVQPIDAIPQTVDDLVRARASQSGCDDPILAYPRSDSEFDYYTPRQLNDLAADVASYYATFLPVRRTLDDPVQVVGLLGVSTFEYLLTLLALTKLGHTVLFLSTRITEEAYVNLLRKTNASTLLVDDGFREMAAKVQPSIPSLAIGAIASQDVVAQNNARPISIANHRDPERERSNITWIIHSSGSTGLPKPIFQTQKAAVLNYATNFNMKGFITLPLFHAHGISCTFRSIYSKKMIYLYGANAPLTSRNLLNTLRNNDISILYAVPYVLKLLAESQEGLDALAKLEIVMFGGSACPKPIGDKLVSHGIRLVSHYGSTETGQLMTSFRPKDDLDWDYVRPSDALKPYLLWEERYPGIHELIVLEGWPSKVMTNRDDGGYATKDLFEKHPTKENAYRYYARLDDTITLMNGEKANPLLVEGVARQHQCVAEAIAFGTGKAKVGLFIIPSVATPVESTIESIWPAIEKTNESMPAYARLSKDMIKVLPQDTQYRKTDKGTVIRAAFYRDFASHIELAYEEEEGDAILPVDELVNFLRQQAMATLGLKDLHDDTDLFSLGVDSLQAAQLRGAIIRKLSTGGQKLRLNFVYDYPNINAMARQLLALQSGTAHDNSRVEDLMEALIEKYSNSFPQHMPQNKTTPGHHVVVTGATGSLGAHIAAQLALLAAVHTVYCLVRAPSAGAAFTRVQSSMTSRKVWQSLPTTARSKIICYPSTFSAPNLGLTESQYSTITSNLTSVIHSAWAVNFNLSLSSFEDCISGLRNLIDLCLSTHRSRPATINFCCSVSAVANTPSRHALEDLPTSLTHAQSMGYAQSKLVAEHICMRATAKTPLTARVLRIGQVIADTKHGIWNTTEAIPLMFQSATTIGALPALDESPAWLPVDTVARTVKDIALSIDAPGRVFNIVNAQKFHWTRDLLPLLKASGLQFETLPPMEWVQRLRKSNPDVAANPPFKLLEFWAGKYEKEDEHDGGKGSAGVEYDTAVAREWSDALKEAGVVGEADVRRFVEYFVGEGWVGRR